MNRIEIVILKNLIYNESYTKKVLPFIKKEYFSNKSEKIIFECIQDFIETYKKLPTHEVLLIKVNELTGLSSQDINEVIEIINNAKKEKNEISNVDWLLNQTEKFCQDRSIYNAIMESVSILDESNKNKGRGEIPKLLSDSLAISFDNHIGHDYMDESEDRYNFYHRVESRISFDVDMFNKITDGGVPNKTLNIIMAGVGVGKTLCMCHLASSFLYQGYDVLYITLEMAEERIAERIDANLFNVKLNDIKKLSKLEFENKVNYLKSKVTGRLIIKEYPTASASVLHFRALLNELQLKKNFKPKVIFIDYLNICCSSRLKLGGSTNSYSYVKAIAEEIRGLAVEYDLPIFSSTQVTRSGFTSSDPGMEDTSESFGLPATCDMMLAVIQNEELERLNQFLVKQLKNRYTDMNFNKRFIIGVEKAKTRLYDVEEIAQNIAESGQEIKSKFNTLKVI